MPALTDLIGNYEAFLTDILQRVEAEGFDPADFVQLDHLCYRTASRENYAAKKAELSQAATLLGEHMVNGRPIATFRLREPLQHGPWRIDAIELPAPKPDTTPTEGLEHIEFVLYDDIETFLQKYRRKSFNMQAADRGVNPEIGLQLGEYQVKFHLLNLPTVIYLQQKLGMEHIRDGE